MPRAADVAYFNHRPGHSESWAQDGACRFAPSKHPWFANGRDSGKSRAFGKAICLELCPVRQHCLAYALSARIDHGTWGGLDESERAKLPKETKVRLVAMCRMTPHRPIDWRTPEEVLMVTVIAKVNFAPNLRPGEVGEIDDNLARTAVRNGYAELVGSVENFDGWMYHGEDLVVSTKAHKQDSKAKAPAKKAPAKRSAKKGPDQGSPATKAVAPTVSLADEATA